MSRFLILSFLALPIVAKDIPLPPPATVPSVAAASDIASDGRDYLAVWYLTGVRGQRISSSGERIGSDFPIIDHANSTVRVTWTGSSYLVVSSNVYARVNAAREVLEQGTIPGITRYLVVRTEFESKRTRASLSR
jgi:hypothetical protein